MAIIKTITENETGLIYSYHRVSSVVVEENDNMYANISSWIDKQRYESGMRLSTRSYEKVNIAVQSNLISLVETAIVANPNSPLFGGTLDTDVVLTDLEKAKANKKAEIASSRNIEIYADKVTSLGTFSSTESDNNKLSVAIQVTQLAAASGQPAECGYKDVDGVWTIYTLAQLEQIALEIASQVIPSYQKESDLTALVDAATDIETVQAITW
jgi:hypothetical protein